MSNLEKLLGLQKKINSLKTKSDQIDGKLEVLYEKLNSQFKVNSVSEANKVLDSIRKKIKLKEQILSRKTKALYKKFKGLK